MNGKKAELTAIIGSTGVSEDPEIENSFCTNASPLPSIRPRFKVIPKNVSEVQEIVRWANRTRTPLVPVSSGEPHLRGATVPSTPESVLVDMSAMKRILKIDRRNRLVLVEPGVTYGELHDALRREGLRIAMPLLPRRRKSVIASLLDREPVMSPRVQWNLLEPLRSLEIIWGNGDRLWSGSGVFRGENEDDWKNGIVPLVGPGPAQLDFYKFVSAAQGTMGVVTWASIKCEVFPRSRMLSFVSADRLEDLIDFAYSLLKFRFGDELFLLNAQALACVLAASPHEVVTMGAALPPWTAVVGIAGGEILANEKVEAQRRDIQDMCQKFGLRIAESVAGRQGSDLMEMLQEPSGEPYWRTRNKGSMKEVFLLCTLEKTPGFSNTMMEAAAEHRYPTSDIGIYLQPVHQGVGCHCEFILPFNREDLAEATRTEELFLDASRQLFRKGAFFSRPYGAWAQMVYNADSQTATVTRKIKAIFDPNQVMNPGKLCF